MSNYNTTQLNPDTTFERHVYHRDQFAHFLRWTHVLNLAKIGMKVLDAGCGSGNLYEVFYRNRFSPTRFVGVDVRGQTIKKNQEKFPKVEWETKDLVNDELPKDDWDVITSFEVIEHIGKTNADKFLRNIKNVMNDKTTFLLSTPCYDAKVGAADNHTYDCGDGNGVIPQEHTYEDLKKLLEEHFIIEAHYGTFASIKDYKDLLTGWQLEMFEKLKDYYDSNILSVMMAPFFPAQARNVLWKLKLKPKTV